MTPATDSVTPESVVYGYAVSDLTLATLADVKGINDAPLRWIRSDSLAMAVSDVTRDSLALLNVGEVVEGSTLAAMIRAHDATVREIFGRHTPILPLRFGSVFESDAKVRQVLLSSADQMQRRLRAIGHGREYGVRITAPAHDATPGDAPTDGRSYLLAAQAERRRSADILRLIHDAYRALERASSISHEARVGRTFLVQPEREGRFLEVLEQATRSGLEVQYTGPWPPYSFTRVDDE